MSDERLIEEAARRYPDNSHTRSTPLYAQMKREAFIEGAVFEKAHTPTTPTDDERETRSIVRRAVGGVLFHVTNFPERVQTHLLGENMGPLNEKITHAVLDALRPSEVPEPSADNRISRAITVLSWRPDHDGDDPARVQDDYMRRAQAADTALAILTENREGAF